MILATCHPDAQHWAKGLCRPCYSQQYYTNDFTKFQGYWTKQTTRHREAMFAALGDICSCCKESEKSFLTLEHKNGTGAEHKWKLGRGKYKASSAMALRDAFREGFPRDKYTVLCGNCQLGETRPDGCPHKRMN